MVYSVLYVLETFFDSDAFFGGVRILSYTTLPRLGLNINTVNNLIPKYTV